MIVSSTYVVYHSQTDGRKYVLETHVDSVGVNHLIEYLWDGSLNVPLILSQHAVTLTGSLAAAEITANIAEVLA